jgi:hypothetical protein
MKRYISVLFQKVEQKYKSHENYVCLSVSLSSSNLIKLHIRGPSLASTCSTDTKHIDTRYKVLQCLVPQVAPFYFFALLMQLNFPRPS